MIKSINKFEIEQRENQRGGKYKLVYVRNKD